MNNIWKNIRGEWTTPNIVQTHLFFIGVVLMMNGMTVDAQVDGLMSMVCGYLLIRNSGFGRVDSFGLVHMIGVLHFLLGIGWMFVFLKANYEVGLKSIMDNGVVRLESLLGFLLVLDSFKSLGLFPFHKRLLKKGL